MLDPLIEKLMREIFIAKRIRQDLDCMRAYEVFEAEIRNHPIIIGRGFRHSYEDRTSMALSRMRDYIWFDEVDGKWTNTP